MGNLTLGNAHELHLPHLHGHTVRLFLNQLIALICNLLTSGCGNKITQKIAAFSCRLQDFTPVRFMCIYECVRFCLCCAHVTAKCLCAGTSAGVRAALVWGRGCGCWRAGRVFLMAPEPSLDPVLVLWLVNSQTLSLRPDRACTHTHTHTHIHTCLSEKKERGRREEEGERGEIKRQFGSPTGWHKHKKTEREKVSRKGKVGLNELDTDCHRVNVSISVTVNAIRQPGLQTSPETPLFLSVKGGVCPLLTAFINYT